MAGPNVLQTLVFPVLPLVTSILVYAFSKPIASFLCQGLDHRVIFEGMSARALATIGTGLLGVYLIASSIPGAAQAIIHSMQDRPEGFSDAVIFNGGVWEQALPVVVGLLILASSVSIGRLLSDYRKLGLEDDAPPNPPSQNTKQS